MLTTAPRTLRLARAHATRPVAPDVARVVRGRGRLTVPDLELLLEAVGDREDRAGTDERARLRRIRGELERDLAELLTE